MKRAAAVLLTLALMLSLTACMSRGSMQLKRADRYFDDLRGAFKMSDVTNSARLIGKRENNGRDWFTGSYTAQCENETGRDTVFGGASARDKLIKVKAYIKTESGTVTVADALRNDLKYGKVYVMLGINELGWYLSLIHI